jgi:transposase
VDNDSRNLFEILPSRSKHTLSSYREKIPRHEREKVRFVTIDMWEP